MDSTENSTQYYVINYMGKESEKEWRERDIYIYTHTHTYMHNSSLCCIAETSTTM